jgi:hypothetical protein
MAGQLLEDIVGWIAINVIESWHTMNGVEEVLMNRLDCFNEIYA